MESFTIICSILGAIASIITILTFRNDHSKKPNEEREFFIAQFQSTRSLSLSVLKKMEEYCKKNNAYDKFIFEDITFSQYIKLLKHSQESDLSEDLLKKTIEFPLTTPMINSMVKSLENQFNELLKVDSWINGKIL
ncbi:MULTISPECIES: hypothetical protein [Sphingobacterium]|uniref:hypothetical protein n=1 Tax=Sphingobacterium TaxID=28453 RepID=UPI0009580451|nr:MULTISPECIES: hypothetical protein [Sphingobacterium]APU98525.1 hypothetical protein BV902_21095 [Sphingobacterium sp. B29]